MCNICRRRSNGSWEPCLVAVLDVSETAAARGFDPHDVARLKAERRLPGHRLAVHEIGARDARLPALCSLRRSPAALADQRKAARLEHAQLTDDPVAPAV